MLSFSFGVDHKARGSQKSALRLPKGQISLWLDVAFDINIIPFLSEPYL